MSDISKCVGTDCAKRETCYRFTAPAREKWQSWLNMPTAVKVVDECKLYWEVKSELCKASDA